MELNLRPDLETKEIGSLTSAPSNKNRTGERTILPGDWGRRGRKYEGDLNSG